MRAVLVVSAMWATLAMATPALHKRAVVTRYHTAVVTEVVTVRAQRTRPHGGRRTRTITIRPSPTTVAEADDEETTLPSPSPFPTVDEPQDEPEVEPTPASTTQESYKPEPTPVEEPEEPEPVSSPGPGGDYQQECLYHHNQHRANHSAPALVWDDGLAQAARVLAERCWFAHDTKIPGGAPYGQNLGARSHDKGPGPVISDWYNNEMMYYEGSYGLANPAVDGAGHFTAVVWVDTQAVGCYTAHCPGGIAIAGFAGYSTVCNYKKPGNWGGGYAENVLPPLGHPVLAA